MARRFLRPQFRLWHLVAAMTLLSVGLAWFADLRQRVARQAAALRVLQMHGATYDAKVASPWKEWLAGGPVDQTMTLRLMDQRSGWDRWGPYGVKGEPVRLHNWEPARFPEVRRSLEELRGITYLSLQSTRLRGHAHALLPASAQITHLGLSETGVHADDLTALSRLPNLQSLSLRRTPADDEALRNIFGNRTPAQLRSFTWLDLSSSDVTDEGMSQVAKLTNLKTLRLENTRLTDDGLRKLALRGLEELQLGMTLVSEKSLPLLIEMRISSFLEVPTEWNPVAVEQLRNSVPPGCQVSASGYELRNREDAKARRK